MKNRFYLACLRDTVGSNVSFHCVDGAGYSTDISKAHVYTRGEAQKAWDLGREFDLPLSADHVDEVAVYHVDCQCVPSEHDLSPNCNKYVAYVRNCWNGNDLKFLTGAMPSFDFEKAKTFSFDEATEYLTPNSEMVFIKRVDAEKAKRKTIQIENVKNKTFVQGAGLKQPSHVKKSKRKSNTGKTRWNCPKCGKISWQYNPYDFSGCNDVYCDEFAIETNYGDL